MFENLETNENKGSSADSNSQLINQPPPLDHHLQPLQFQRHQQRPLPHHQQHQELPQQQQQNQNEQQFVGMRDSQENLEVIKEENLTPLQSMPPTTLLPPATAVMPPSMPPINRSTTAAEDCRSGNGVKDQRRLDDDSGGETGFRHPELQLTAQV